jgi:thioesterase domain-containing protein/acyl carrier protein
VDLSLLPAPGSSEASSTAADDYVAPRDELESRLVAIWEEVLAVRPIGIRTQFFKLGGYSLMIVRLFARINKVLGTSLPITTIFNAPTVEQLADVVRGRAYYSSLVPVRTTGKQTPFFMIHSYLLYQGIPAVLGEDQPFYGLRELDTDAEDMTVEQRAATYLDAIRSIQPRGPYYIGGWCAAGPLAVETARQIRASGEEVGFLVLFDSWRPGYAAELAREQAGSREMSLQARLGRKYRFHRNRLGSLSTGQRIRYVGAAISSKFTSVRNRIYLKNWAIAEWFCHRFGLSLPHFMHNVSLTTLNSLKEYRGIEPYTGSLTLIRAKDAPYIPGALDHCGWDAIVKGGVKVFWAPGDHESMFLDPNLQEVGQLLRENLANASIQQKQYAETT